MSRPRIMIIDGPDCTGKTTLARDVAKQARCPYWHMTCGPGLDNHKAMRLYQNDAVKNALINLGNGISTVFDRLWPSDYCYGHVLRGEPSVDWQAMRDILHDVGCVYVFTLRPDAVKAHAEEKDGDHPYSDEHYKEIIEQYEWLWGGGAMAGQKAFRYDVSRVIDHPDLYVAEVIRFANMIS